MGSAFQALPPPGPPPPGVVYPTTVTNQPSPQSNGSFGTVFVVLAIILAVSVVACVLGRLCNKRSQRAANHQPRGNNGNNDKYRDNHGHDQRFSVHHDDHHNSQNLPPNGRSKERDVEFGFGPNEFGPDKKIPKIKIVPREDGRGMSPQNGEFGGHSRAQQMPRMMESPRNFA